MANLKDDLDEYLLLQSDQKKSFKIDMKMPTLKVPEMKNLFGKSEPQEANGWLKDTTDSCCPKFVMQKYLKKAKKKLIEFVSIKIFSRDFNA